LADWDSILTTADAQFVSLQYGDVNDSIASALEKTGIRVEVDGEVDPLADFDAAAAQVAAMDLIIATSNTAVHLAGALGKTVWVMVPAVPDWRWGLEGDTAPWYPNLRLFRQKEPGDWAPVIRDVSTALKQWCAAI
jgi:ADP-heptose:LPS heptosyltransferase